MVTRKLSTWYGCMQSQIMSLLIAAHCIGHQSHLSLAWLGFKFCPWCYNSTRVLIFITKCCYLITGHWWLDSGHRNVKTHYIQLTVRVLHHLQFSVCILLPTAELVLYLLVTDNSEQLDIPLHELAYKFRQKAQSIFQLHFYSAHNHQITIFM